MRRVLKFQSSGEVPRSGDLFIPAIESSIFSPPKSVWGNNDAYREWMNFRDKEYMKNPKRSVPSTSNSSGGNSGENSGKKFTNIAKVLGGALDIASSASAHSKYNNDPSFSENNASRNAISSGIMQLGVVGAGIGLAQKAANTLYNATGVSTNEMSYDAANVLNMSESERRLNNFWTKIGNITGFGGPKVDDTYVSEDTKKLDTAYGDTVRGLLTAESISGNRYNPILSQKVNDFNKEASKRIATEKLLTDISRTNTYRKNSDSADNINSQTYKRLQNYDYGDLKGKEGLKLPNKEELQRIYSAKKQEIAEFKNGGVIGVDSNVIPEGKLHRELNHMEEVNEELDKVITDKGIAIVVTDTEGKVEQVAEIEKEEIVFRLALTKKIEELWHDGSEAAMIKAGKILARELLGNTDDNTETLLDGDN